MASLDAFAFAEPALAYLSTIPAGKLRGQVLRKARSLAENTYPPGCKRMEDVMDGELSVFRVRSGDYRILYSVRPGPYVVVLDIGNRKDVYRGT